MNWQHTGTMNNATGVKTKESAASGLVATERRRARRRRVLYRARLAFNNTTLNCTVKDISEYGCKLKLAVPPVLPETFELIMNKTGERRKCQLVWLSDCEVGVCFTDVGE